MSWTSEFELPPQRPGSPSGPESNGDAIDEEPEPAGPGFNLADIPDEGPLDPSVFDGLFDDLVEPEPAVEAEPEPETEVEWDAEPEREPEAELEADWDAEPGPEPAVEAESEFTDDSELTAEPSAVSEPMDDPGRHPLDGARDAAPDGELVILEADSFELEDLIAADESPDKVDSELAHGEPIDDVPGAYADNSAEQRMSLVEALDDGPGLFDEALDDGPGLFDEVVENRHTFVDEVAAGEQLTDIDEGFTLDQFEDVEDVDEYDEHDRYAEADAFDTADEVEDVDEYSPIDGYSTVGEVEDPANDFTGSTDEGWPDGGIDSGVAPAAEPMLEPDFDPVPRQPVFIDPVPIEPAPIEPLPIQPVAAASPQPLILEQQVPAVSSSPPIAFDDPYPQQYPPETEPVGFQTSAEIVDRLHPATVAPPKPKRRWPSFVGAIVVGGVFGIGGAVLLTTLRETEETATVPDQTSLVANQVDADQSPLTDPTRVSATDPADGTADQPGAVAGEADREGPVSLLADGHLVSHGISFVAGTTDLTPEAETTLQRIAASVDGLEPEPTAITVRTFTEPTAQANRELSERQARALADYLASMGVQFGGVAVRGLGAAPLVPELPVHNFVVARPALQNGDLKDGIDSISPFEIGIDPNTRQLRPESLVALAQIARALAADPEGSLSLAGYAYDRPTADANKALAIAAVDAARTHLVNTHQIDPDRLVLLAPGPLPYALGPIHGGHVEIERGRSLAVEVAIHSGDGPLLTFAAGSDALSQSTADALDRLATLLTDTNNTVVVSVRSSNESSPEAGQMLSAQRGAAIAAYLSDAGLADGRVRVYEVDDLATLRLDSPPDEVTLIVLS